MLLSSYILLSHIAHNTQILFTINIQLAFVEIESEKRVSSIYSHIYYFWYSSLSKFLYGIITLPCEEPPLTFLMVQVCWQWLLSLLFVWRSFKFCLYFRRIFSLDIDFEADKQFLCYFKYVIPSLLVHVVSYKKSSVINSFFYIMYLFSLANVKVFFVSLVIMIHFCVVLFGSIRLKIHWASWNSEFIVFIKIIKKWL